MLEAMGGAPKKWCGICWPTLYSTAMSVGGGMDLRWLEDRGLS